MMRPLDPQVPYDDLDGAEQLNRLRFVVYHALRQINLASNTGIANTLVIQDLQDMILTKREHALESKQ